MHHAAGFLTLKKARTFVNKQIKKWRRQAQHKALLLHLQRHPEQAINWGIKNFLTPQHFRPTADEIKVLARATQSEMRVGSELVHLWHWGQGPRVLFLHGWSGRGGQFAHWVDLLLEAGFAVTTLDAPGHGHSEGDESSMLRFIETLRQVEAELGAFEAVIGHSLGGAAALIATAQGLQTQRLITLGAPANIYDVMQRGFGQKMGLSNTLTQQAIVRLESRFGQSMQELHPEILIARIQQPVLVIHDLDDGEIPWADAEKLVNHALQAELLTTKGQGHTRILRNSEVILAARSFLLGNEPQPLVSPNMTSLLGS